VSLSYRPRPAALALLALLGLFGGCAESEPNTQPVPQVSTFETGKFDDIPLFPRSDPAGPRSEAGDVVAQSFVALGTTPEQVLEFYERALAGRWHLVSPISQLGVATFRADWVRDDFRLRVSATREQTLAPEDNASSEVAVQYSLTLEPLATVP